MKNYKVMMANGDVVTVEADTIQVDDKNNLRFGVKEGVETPVYNGPSPDHRVGTVFEQKMALTRLFAAGQWVHVRVDEKP